MGTNFFADRGFLTINGNELGNVKTVKVTIDEAITVVDTMSRNKRSSGYKQGNRKITGSFELEIPDLQAQLDMAFLYGKTVNMIAQFGTNSERHSLLSLVQNSQDLSGSVGETSKTINFTALDAVNENGNSVNSLIGF